MAGAVKTLYQTLQSAPSMSGVAFGFGQEYVWAEDMALPRVVLVPVGGAWTEPGYTRNLDPSTEMLWSTMEQIDIYCVAADASSTATCVDHTDAVEGLRTLVLQALQYQRAYMDSTGTTQMVGMFYKPISGRWIMDEVERYGRAYVLSVQVDVTVTTADPSNGEATITTVNVTDSISS